MPDYIEEMMSQKGLFEDFFTQKELAEIIGVLLNESEMAEVTSVCSTNISFKLGTRKSNVESGIYHKPGSLSSRRI